MQMTITDNAEALGKKAAAVCADMLRETLQAQAGARIVLSTGASQFEFLRHFVQAELDWERVEMFHLDEYVGLSEQHPASFRRYLRERFLQYVDVQRYWLVDGEGDTEANIRRLSDEIGRAPIDLALIGIGENAHIAFNDPPADFITDAPYKIVDLDEACKRQQVGEGWFVTVDDVPKQAITMTVRQILRSRHIVSCVPHRVKAKAIRETLQREVDPMIPATMLKTHPSWHLFLDAASASEIYVSPGAGAK